MRERFVILSSLVVLVVLMLSGCRSGENVGDIAWLDYGGPHREAVLICVDALPDTIEGKRGDYPSAAEFSSVSVEADELDDVRTAYLISGSLKLSYATSHLDFSWECEVLNRAGVLGVTEVRHELLSQ